jgi:alpha-L-fucosidase
MSRSWRGQAALAGLTLGLAGSASAQAYQPPADSLVQAKLEAWQDMKFGLLLHWGTYSQWGVVESWSICSEPWISRGGADYTQYVEDYEALATTFNPTRFDPGRWAGAASDAGIRYMVFTTKHHDGFNMFDTGMSDYGIAGPDSPFRDDPRSNVTRVLFDAFREEELAVGAYFSKPDWHHDDYWAHEWATPDRNNNYDLRRFPERWQRFKDFTFGQIEELMTGYGPVDILWLDGGWVRPDSTINEEVISWGYDIPDWEQDIGMPRIVEMARANQPGLIVVDRTVHGPYEDYRTPEQRVPDHVITDYPWESNMSMSQSWSFSRNPRYKSARQLIHTLVDVVSKGGNFLLGIGPGPDGTWDAEAYERLEEIGDWLRPNAEAIYGTRPVTPFSDGPVRFTRSRKSGAVYATYLVAEGDEAPPDTLRLVGIIPAEGAVVSLLATGEVLSWIPAGTGMLVQIPAHPGARTLNPYAWTLKISAIREY